MSVSEQPTVSKSPTEEDSDKSPWANNIETLQKALAKHRYIAERALSTSVFLALELERPLFLEGEPGVGKTELARALAGVLGGELIRLQCYEGLDLATAAYEWNYTRQILSIRAAEAEAGNRAGSSLDDLYTEEFLLERPLLQALRPPKAGARSVLLIDELDRADEEFEAFLLEVLADFQITIPELGTVRAETPPLVLITSNRTREVHDALKRRCLYQWVEFPDFEKEFQIVLERVPQAPKRLAQEVVHFVQALRNEDLYKRPGVAESIDWLGALIALDHETLSDEILRDTLGVLLKYQDDIEALDDETAKRLLHQAREAKTL